MLVLALVRVPANAAGGDYKAKDWHRKMLELVNKERASSGKPPMCLNLKLIQAAQKHSDWMAAKGKMSHNEEPGPNDHFDGRIKGAGFKMAGGAENVAHGQQTIADVMKSWMNSPGHRRNILGDSKFAGFGFQKGKSGGNIPGLYWTQVFANSGDEECLK